MMTKKLLVLIIALGTEQASRAQVAMSGVPAEEAALCNGRGFARNISVPKQSFVQLAGTGPLLWDNFWTNSMNRDDQTSSRGNRTNPAHSSAIRPNFPSVPNHLSDAAIKAGSGTAVAGYLTKNSQPRVMSGIIRFFVSLTNVTATPQTVRLRLDAATNIGISGQGGRPSFLERVAYVCRHSAGISNDVPPLASTSPLPTGTMSGLPTDAAYVTIAPRNHQIFNPAAPTAPSAANLYDLWPSHQNGNHLEIQFIIPAYGTRLIETGAYGLTPYTFQFTGAEWWDAAFKFAPSISIGVCERQGGIIASMVPDLELPRFCIDNPSGSCGPTPTTCFPLPTYTDTTFSPPQVVGASLNQRNVLTLPDEFTGQAILINGGRPF
jgi:hypothetical protein